MTRLLSELLGAPEPAFRQGLLRLEAASGRQSTDIRLTAEIERATGRKLRELGLDSYDTTGEELYAALQQKVKGDDERLSASLCQKYGLDGSPTTRIRQALLDLPVPRSCFALKTTAAKRLLAGKPPKQTMKALGYRSFDSMMRREQVIAVFAASWLLETVGWRKAMIDTYKKLKSNDFEIRPMVITAPHAKQWQSLAEVVVTQKKHAIVGLKELGAVVLLPLPADQPPAAWLTTLLLGLHEMNEVRASSTYLKLCQVKPDFGAYVQIVVADEPTLGAELFDQPVPWQIIQRYYARYADRFRPELFEPHIQQEDLSWHSIERCLEFIEPALAFWRHTANLGLLHRHQPVSLNVVDAALSFCNHLPYEHRIVHYFRHNLWHELIIRYLKHDSVEQTVLDGLASRLIED